MADEIKSGDNSKAAAVEAANHLVDRLQDEVGEYTNPKTSPAGQREAVEQMIGDLEASPEVRTIRQAGGEDPAKFGSANNAEGRAARRLYDEADDTEERSFAQFDADRELLSGEADFSKDAPDRVTGPIITPPD